MNTNYGVNLCLLHICEHPMAFWNRGKGAYFSMKQWNKCLLYIIILSGIPSKCQTACIQIRPDILSGLIWVQIVCKGFQQMTLAGKELMESY